MSKITWPGPTHWVDARTGHPAETVVGLDLATGNELWRSTGFQPFTSSPTVNGDTLYFSNGGQSSNGPPSASAGCGAG